MADFYGKYFGIFGGGGGGGGGGSGVTPYQETPSGVINNSNKVFTLTVAPSPVATLALYLDGLILVQGTDYTISSTTITMIIAPNFGQTLYATYSVSSNTYSQEIPSGTINNSNKAFSLAHTPISAASVSLFEDGLILVQGTDYTISGSSITMIIAPNFGQTLYATYSY